METKAPSQSGAASGNHSAFWLDVGVGPGTAALLVNRPYPIPVNWNSLTFGTRLAASTAHFDIGLTAGSTLSDTFYPQHTNRNEFGILFKPRHATHPAFQSILSLRYTDADNQWRNGRFTPGVGYQLSLPALELSAGESPFALQPYIDAHLFAGWNADPVSYLRTLKPTDRLPSLGRFGVGIRLVLGTTALEDKWNAARIATLFGEQAMMLYPAVTGAFAVGTMQTVFIDGPHDFLPYHRFLLDDPATLFDVNHHPFWKKHLDNLERPNLKTVQNQMQEAGSVSASLGAGLGGIFGVMAASDATLIQAVQREEIHPAVSHVSLLTKTGLGLAAIGISLLGREYPGQFSRFGGDSHEYGDRVEKWANDHRFRGAEYLGHGLLLSAALSATQWEDPDPALSAIGLGGLGALLLSAQIYYTQFMNPEEKVYYEYIDKQSIRRRDFYHQQKAMPAEFYYNRERISAHLALAGSAFVTFGLMSWLKSSGWNSF